MIVKQQLSNLQLLISNLQIIMEYKKKKQKSDFWGRLKSDFWLGKKEKKLRKMFFYIFAGS